MIVAIAEANVEDSESHHLTAAWSNFVVGDKPAGLVDCLFLEGDQGWLVISTWEDEAALIAAESDEGAHPAYVVFDAASTEVTHRSLKLVGRFATDR